MKFNQVSFFVCKKKKYKPMPCLFVFEANIGTYCHVGKRKKFFLEGI